VIYRQLDLWLATAAVGTAIILRLLDSSPFFSREVSTVCLKMHAPACFASRFRVWVAPKRATSIAVQYVSCAIAPTTRKLAHRLLLTATLAGQRSQQRRLALGSFLTADLDFLGTFRTRQNAACWFSTLATSSGLNSLRDFAFIVGADTLQALDTVAPTWFVGSFTTQVAQSFRQASFAPFTRCGRVAIFGLFRGACYSSLKALLHAAAAIGASSESKILSGAFTGNAQSRCFFGCVTSPLVRLHVEGHVLPGLLRSGLVLTLIGSHDALSSRDSGCGEDPSGRANAYPGPFVLHSKWHSGKLGNVADEATAVLTVGTSDRAGVLI
jgi:hypothetical protein